MFLDLVPRPKNEKSPAKRQNPVSLPGSNISTTLCKAALGVARARLACASVRSARRRSFRAETKPRLCQKMLQRIGALENARYVDLALRLLFRFGGPSLADPHFHGTFLLSLTRVGLLAREMGTKRSVQLSTFPDCSSGVRRAALTYSGGTAPDSDRLPFYALRHLSDLFSCQT